MCHQFFIVLLLFFLTFLVVLPVLCNRLKYSWYYGVVWSRNITEENRQMNKENNLRLLVAREELILKKFETKIVEKPSNFTDIIITVITVSRVTRDYNPYYLTQTVGKLLHLLRKEAATLDYTYSLMLCNVDSSPSAFAEAKELSKFLHSTVKYATGLNRDTNRFEKEKQDYVYCLEKSLEFQPKYVLLIEDDAYPADRMLPVLEYSIQNIFEGRFSEYFNRRKKVAYLKLYHPERLLSFISLEIYRLFELAGAVALLLTFIAAFKRTRLSSKAWKLVTLTGVYIVLLALAIGRQNIIGFRTVSPYLHIFVGAPSCCTPANLYSYNGAKAVVSMMSHKVCFPGHAKDALLDEFLTESGYCALYVEPNIFKHIGQYSSLRQGLVLDPYVV